jgi:SAM-dependent methyltransferase
VDEKSTRTDRRAYHGGIEIARGGSLAANETPRRPSPTRRFSDRVEHYRRSRPGYPRELAIYLREELGLTPAAVVADVGSGTGLLTRLLLELGTRVLAIEPNASMRAAAERALGGHPGFESRDGTAEASGLAASSIDLVTAAQAFHWFDVELARREFQRILVPGGRVALIWNRRRPAGNPFLEGYERLLVRWASDYEQVDHRKTAGPEVLADFFRGSDHGQARFLNLQVLGWEGLKARLLSSSYTPLPGHPDHEPMMRELRRIFDQAQRDGRVRLEYDTEVHHGRLDDVAPAPHGDRID